MSASSLSFDYTPTRGPLSVKERGKLLLGDALTGLKASGNVLSLRKERLVSVGSTIANEEVFAKASLGIGATGFDLLGTLRGHRQISAIILRKDIIGDNESVEALGHVKLALRFKVLSSILSLFLGIVAISSLSIPPLWITVLTLVSLGSLFFAIYNFVKPVYQELQMAKKFHDEVVKVQRVIKGSNLDVGSRAIEAKKIIHHLLGQTLPFNTPGKQSLLDIPKRALDNDVSKDEDFNEMYKAHLSRRISVKGDYYISNNRDTLVNLSTILNQGSDVEKTRAIDLISGFLGKIETEAKAKKIEQITKIATFAILSIALIFSTISVLPVIEIAYSFKTLIDSTLLVFFATSIYTNQKKKAEEMIYQNGNLGDSVQTGPMMGVDIDIDGGGIA